MTMTRLNIQNLKQALATEAEIVFAYLFGSTVTGETSALSDVDVAIHPDRRLSLDERLAILQRLGKKTGLENLDVTFLDRLKNLYLLNHLIDSGVLLVDRDRDRREPFEVRAQHRLFDFRYHRKLYLGESMSIEAITRKIARIREYVAVLKSLQPDCVTRMKSDKVYRGAVLYHPYMMADSCVTLAEMLIKLKGLRRPQSYAETIDILGESGIIPGDFACDFAHVAGCRNFLAHDHEKIDYAEICQVMSKKLDDVNSYLGYIESIL